MWILAVETSSRIGSCALLQDSVVRHARTFDRGMIHGTELGPAVQDLLRAESITPTDLDGISVSIGPGSYTGLRIGVAFAKTLAYVVRCPIVGVNAMQATAAQVDRPLVSVLLDARKNEIYASSYRDAAPIEEGWIGPAATWIERQPEGSVFAGTAVELCREAIEHAGFSVAPEETWTPHAETIGTLGAARLVAGESDDVIPMTPIYMRPFIPTVKGAG
jgi:tRNA threonylcarbamoyladenosine biosynthesis protein TsaB